MTSNLVLFGGLWRGTYPLCVVEEDLSINSHHATWVAILTIMAGVSCCLHPCNMRLLVCR